jgi:hypothetical protein
VAGAKKRCGAGELRARAVETWRTEVSAKVWRSIKVGSIRFQIKLKFTNIHAK